MFHIPGNPFRLSRLTSSAPDRESGSPFRGATSISLLLVMLAACAGPAGLEAGGAAPSEADSSRNNDVVELQNYVAELRHPDISTLDGQARDRVSECLVEHGLPEGTVLPRGWFGAGPDLDRLGLRTDGTVEPSGTIGYGHTTQLDSIVWSSWMVDDQGRWLADPGEPIPPMHLTAEQRPVWQAAVEQCSDLGQETVRALGRDATEQELARRLDIFLEEVHSQEGYRQAIQRWHHCLPSDIRELGDTPEQLDEYFLHELVDLVDKATALAEAELERQGWASHISPTEFITVDVWRERMPEIDDLADAELRAAEADDSCWRRHVETVVDDLWHRLDTEHLGELLDATANSSSR